ncbi:hypothetical protein [Brevibacillus sp. SIMBA_040]|uniref:hypothetical protein n=1 Tax=unclassified Brevibacillus TaxID=2684853 RepID=UPI00397CB6A9
MTKELLEAAQETALTLCTQIKTQANNTEFPHDLESMAGIVHATTELLHLLSEY